MQIVLSEDILTDVDEYPDAGPLDGTPAPAVSADDPQGDAPPDDKGLERASKTAEAMDAIGGDPFLRRRFARLLEKFPDFVQSYAKLLGDSGPAGDAAMAKQLGVTVDKLEPHLQKLHEEALDLADEAED